MRKLWQTGDGWGRRTVYKFVDPGVADFVESGSLRIGTLRGYANLENSRKDTGEYATSIHVDELTIDNENPSPFSFFATALPGPIYMRQARIIDEGPDLHCFCVAGDLDAKPGEDHAAFQIDDFEGLADAITARHSVVLGRRFAVGTIFYASRSGKLGEGMVPSPDPFVKDEAFAWEKEVRVCWVEPPRFKSNLPIGSIEPFNTKADKVVASFLKRIY